MKNKDKLNLIDDYIRVTQILNFLIYIDKKNLSIDKISFSIDRNYCYADNHEDVDLDLKDKIKESTLLAINVKKLYEELIDLLNMNDLSMKVLIKDLEAVDYDSFLRSINVTKKIDDYVIILNVLNKKVKENFSNLSNTVRGTGVL